MQFVDDLIDYENAPEFHATGVAAISRLSSGTVRITLYDCRECADGTIEQRVMVHILCDLETLEGAPEVVTQLLAAAQSAPPINGRARRRIGAH